MADPEAAAALKAEGNAFFKAKNFIKAAGCYKKATKKDPANPVLHSNFAAALIGLKKFTMSLAAADACLKLDDASEKGLYRRAVSLAGLERYDEAILAFEATLAINPGNKNATKELHAAAKKSRNNHKAGGTEVPEYAAKYAPVKKEKTKEELEAKEKEAGFKFPETVAVPEADGDAAAADADDGPGLCATAPHDHSGHKDLEPSTTQQVQQAVQHMQEGDLVEYSMERVGRFMATEIANLCKPDQASSYSHPIAVFLPGRQKEDWGDEGQGVSMRNAFDSPDTYKNCLPFLRDYAEKTAAHAVLMIAHKSQIYYPQVWNHKDKKWPHGDSAGYFVQLDTRRTADSRVWFIKVEGDTYTRHELDSHYYSFIQKILKGEAA